MRHGSLFSGIGGFDLAAEWMGWENIFHCEWNPFGQRVLKHYWPNAKSYNDITQTDFTIHRGSIDILTGGFPCQPYSAAGKRLGKEDSRHLWPEMLRVIREVAPKYIVGENVLGLVNWNGGLVFDEVQADLEAAGYQVATVVIPAAAVNAPHGRDRVWFVAHNNGIVWREGRKFKSRKQSRYGESNESCNTKIDGNAEDTLRDGRIQRESIEEGAEVREQRNAGAGDTERICGTEMAGLTADTDGIGQPGKEYWNTQSGQHFQNSQRNDWDNFPTQPPICSGDDGLPGELDGITFSKWRNESIRAYGNAIVSNVAFEIFKVIQTIETQS